MIELYRNAWVAGGVLGALLLLAPSARARGFAPALLLGLVAAGLGLGFLIPRDLLELPGWVDLELESAALIGWALWTMAARRAPRPWLPGPPAVAAWLAGALFGEIAGAALVAAPAKDRGEAARLAMAAAAGGLVGRVGDPTLLALGERVSALWLLPVSAILLLLARPTEAPQPGGSRAMTALGLVVAALCAMLPAWSPLALLGGAAASLALGRREDADGGSWRELAWVASAVGIGLVAAVTGLWELGAEGMEYWAGALGGLPLGLLAAVSGLGALLLDGPAAGINLAALLDRAADLRVPGAEIGLAVGAAAGGIGPLVVADALRAGWRRWLIGLLLTSLYAAACATLVGPM